MNNDDVVSYYTNIRESIMKKLLITLLFLLPLGISIYAMEYEDHEQMNEEEAMSFLYAILPRSDMSSEERMLSQVFYSNENIKKMNRDCDLLEELDKDQKRIDCGEKVSSVSLKMVYPTFEVNEFSGKMTIDFERICSTDRSSCTIQEWQNIYAIRMWLFNTELMKLRLAFAQKEPGYSASVVNELAALWLENERVTKPYKNCVIKGKKLDELTVYDQTFLQEPVMQRVQNTVLTTKAAKLEKKRAAQALIDIGQ
jgi:hypothetical protein